MATKRPGGGAAHDKLTAGRLRWLLQLEQGPHAAPGRSRDATRCDCEALGWVQWVKDADGEYVHGPGEGARVLEELSDAGRAVLAAWRSGDRKFVGRRVEVDRYGPAVLLSIRGLKA